MADEDEEDEGTTSEEYEAKALEALDSDAGTAAGVYAILALVATIREATFVLAETLDGLTIEDAEDDDTE